MEANFDGLIGPTHSYAGLSFGNLASHRNSGSVARPRDAALQGLAKMRFLHDLGLRQGVIPPCDRPDITVLRRLGFSGSDQEIVRTAATEAPALLANMTSASSMWAANAATVAPSADTEDGRVHFTPANLVAKLHRSIEAPQTSAILRAVFPSTAHFEHHDPLPCGTHFGDEGAANHTRFFHPESGRAVHLFVFGRSEFDGSGRAPARFPARQTREASEAVARLHRLHPDAAVFAQQNPAAIDAGVFHNDVISVGNGNVFLCHEGAFEDPAQVCDAIDRQLGGGLVRVMVTAAELPWEDAVSSYLFNSQLVSVPGGRMALIVPTECQENERAWAVLDRILDDESNPIDDVHVVDVRQSMRNGGGPACLRLRVALTDDEWAAVTPGCRFSPALHESLKAWVARHYREELPAADIVDPALMLESRTALDELTELMGLGSVYPFQRG
jgi:succinylarginine dihydrolase